MREILFRGLRTDGKGWVYGDLLTIVHHGYFIVEHGCIIHKVIPESVGQYLGFKASGVDVYDGDLIAYYSGMEGREIGYSEDGRLVWKTPHGHFTISARELHDEFQMQVIGNIHEKEVKR